MSENPTSGYRDYAAEILDELTGVLGIAQTKETSDADEDKINELIAKRAEFKRQKDFKSADAVRDELAKMGIEIKDTREGVKWKRI